MSSQVHIVFCKSLYSTDNDRFDMRPFSQIRSEGLVSPDADVINSFSCSIVHELAHAVSMLSNRPDAASISDGEDVDPSGMHSWAQLNAIRRGAYGRYSSLKVAYTYETAFKLLCLSNIQYSYGQYFHVGWQFGSVDPLSLLSLGPNGQVYTFQGRRMQF